MLANPAQSRGPYNLPPGGRDVERVTYNPMADARPDAAEFNPDRAEDLEDRKTARSDETGQVPRVDDLLSSTTDEERNVCDKTHGNRVDAYKQEREAGRLMQESGTDQADQDAEIGRAAGY
ncbi:hypothetical protein OBBRIDRAFT_809880 [Obba rivulosa]|uniref:Uncharacterized protein n=1 Tax=Obba rivulosa TaxID=1052685 RepID=A0A8E2DTD9_9APHY|nr:hypothetical protein OBBRIDRAFT_809880 [Obba rivulosa]